MARRRWWPPRKGSIDGWLRWPSVAGGATASEARTAGLHCARARAISQVAGANSRVERRSSARARSLQRRRDHPQSHATVTFVSERTSTTVRVPLDAARKQTLLDVARQSGVPILFNCEAGGCGACVVRVAPLTVETLPVALTESEDFLLRSIAALAARAPQQFGSTPPTGALRLACQYVIGQGEIRVTFTDPFGAG